MQPIEAGKAESSDPKQQRIMVARALAVNNREGKVRYRFHKHEHNKAPKLMEEEEFEKAAGLHQVEEEISPVLNSKDSVKTKHEKMVKIATDKAVMGKKKLGIKGLA